MTLPELEAPRKRRRLGLYGPFAALILFMIAWSAGWFWMRAEVFRRMDGGAERLAEAGYRIDWSRRDISGFPFRLDLDLAEPRVREVSGWGLSAPRLKAEAWIYSPDKWVVVIPSGGRLIRRVGGPVGIRARVLRASLWEMDAHPPRLSVEARGLTFAAEPGAAAWPLARASEFHLHTRAGPNDQGAVLFQIGGARFAGGGVLAALAGDAAVDVLVETTYGHARALAGHGLAGALRGWTEAGGVLDVRGVSLVGGGTDLKAGPASLTVGGDGRARGILPVRIARAAGVLDRLGERGLLAPATLQAARTVIAARAANGPAVVPIAFQAGQTTLGPVALGPAPRVY